MSKKILLCSTSASSMGGNPTGLWLAELAEPYYAFKAAGFDVTIASPAGGPVPIDAGSMKGDFFSEDSKKFLHDADAYSELSHSKKLDESMTGYDCVYLCGGHGCCVDFAGEKAAALVSIIVS
jgi:putative intracellular protease/amidase